jgi:hypothetical protein
LSPCSQCTADVRTEQVRRERAVPVAAFSRLASNEACRL